MAIECASQGRRRTALGGSLSIGLLAALVNGALLAQTASQASPTSQPAAPRGPSLRGIAHGEVRQRGGEAWGGVDVQLFSLLDPAERGFGLADELKVQTDARGRFKVGVLVGRRYRAWVCVPAGSGHRVASTDQMVIAGRAVLLREAAHIQPQVRVILPQKLADKKLRLQVIERGDNGRIQVVPNERGQVVLPPSDRGWETIQAFGVGAGQESLAWWSALKEGGEVIDLLQDPGARMARLQVFSFERSKPIRRAMVLMPTPIGATPVAWTDEHGIAEVQRSSAYATFFARTPGHMIGGFINGQSELSIGEKDRAIDSHAHVTRNEPLVLRVLLRPGEPARGMPVSLSSMSMYKRGITSTGSFYKLRLRCGDKGEVDVGATLSFGYYGRVTMALSEADIRQLPAEWQVGLQPVAELFLQPYETAAGAVKNGAHEVVLGRWVPLDLRVTVAGGAPAEEAAIDCTTIDQFHRGDSRGRRWCTDAHGRLRVLLQPGVKLGIVARTATGWGAVGLTAKSVAGVIPQLTVELEKGITLRGRVTGADGEPVSGVSVSIWRSAGRYSVGESSRFTIQKGEASLTMDRTFTDSQSEHLDQLLAVGRIQSMTDATGRFEVTVPQVAPGITYRVQASTTIDGQRRSAGVTVDSAVFDPRSNALPPVDLRFE